MYSLCLWIPFILLYPHPALGVVHQLYSSLSTMERTHSCAGELLTVICDATGLRTEWHVGENSVEFHTGNRVNDVRTDGKMTALLLSIQNADGSDNDLKTFSSVVFIKITNTSEPGNITCSSNTDTFRLFNSIAESPRSPESTKITYLGTSDANNSVQYLVQWSLPTNIEEFDLDHYELMIGNGRVVIDTKESSAIISIKKGTPANTATIVTTDRCGTKSRKDFDISVKSIGGTGGLNNDFSTNTTSSCTCGLYKIVLSIIVTLCVALLVIIIIIVIIIVGLQRKVRPEIPHKELPEDKTSIITANL